MKRKYGQTKNIQKLAKKNSINNHNIELFFKPTLLQLSHNLNNNNKNHTELHLVKNPAKNNLNKNLKKEFPQIINNYIIINTSIIDI